MFRHFSFLIAVSIFALQLCARGAQAQPDDKSVFNGPPAPQEMKLLADFVGTWKTEATAKASLSNKEEYTAKGELKCQMIHNGHFLQLAGYGISKHGRFEYTAIISYNRLAKNFRQSVFTSEGIAGESAGEWDPNTRTLTLKGVNLPAGLTSVSTLKLDGDRLMQTLLVKNKDGETTRDSSVVAERKR